MWSPYIVGAAIGVLVWISFLLCDKAIGCSTAYARTMGMAEKIIRGDKVHEKHYYQKFVPKVDWEWCLVFGIVIGSLLSSLLSGTFEVEFVPNIWVRHFGYSIIIRLIIALVGGILIGFGARFAGGCTSGHGISGTIQLSLGSWIAFLSFFVGGIITAFLLYGVF